MNIAAMNKKVTFLRLSVVEDRYGNHRNEWQEDFSVYATIGGETGTEKSEAGLTIPKDSFTVTVRWCTKTASVTTDSYRIQLDGVQYNILSIDRLNYRKHALKYICSKEGVGNARCENR